MSDSNFVDAVRKNYLFSSLSQEIINEIVSSLEVLTFKLGEPILKKNEPGEGFYIVYKGKVRVVDDKVEGKPITLAVLTEGQGFGESSLFLDQPVSATVRSAAKLVLLKLSAEKFKLIAESQPEIGEKIKKAYDTQSEFNFLKSQKLISNLSPDKIRELISKIETKKKHANEVIFDEGSVADAILFVKDGQVRLTKTSAENRLLGVRRKSELFGEMALLSDELRTETATADTDGCVLFELMVEDFKRVIGDNNQVEEQITEYAKQQLLKRQVMLAHNEAQTEEKVGDKHFKLVERGYFKEGGFFGASYPLSRVSNPDLTGVACIDMISRFFDRKIDYDIVEQQNSAPNSEDLHSIGRKSESQGLMSRLVKLGNNNLSALNVPAVYIDPEYGLTVIYKIGSKQILIAEPMRGWKKISRTDFTKRWNGEALTLTVAPDFGAVGDNAAGLFKQFIPLMKPHRSLIAKILFITILVQLAGALPPFFTQILVDNVLVVGDYDLLVLMLIGLVVATFLVTVADAVRDFLSLHLTRRITATLFTRFFDHILSLPDQVLKKWDTGALTARFEENETVLNTMSSGALTIVMNTFSVLVYTPILITMHPALSCVTIFFCLCISAVTLLCAKKIRHYEQMDFDLGVERESHIIEVVKGIDTIKALAQEDEFIDRGKGFFAREMNLSYRKERFDQRLEFVVELLEALSNILVMGIGAWLVVEGKMSPGALIAFAALSAMVTNPIEELAGFYDEWLEFKIALQRINDILSAKREQSDGFAICPNISGGIKFENVSFKYDDQSPDNVLKNINLVISPGQKVAFVGRSGSGKSTLVNMVNGILTPTSGRVLVDDIDVSAVDVMSLRRQIGVVEQSPFVFSGTVRENITITNPSISYEAVVSAATLSGVHEFASNLPMRYDTRIGEGGRALSGGQQQRLIIARALVADPRILILDEATAALDNESEKIIQKNLDKIMTGRTVLAIAHRLSTIRNSDLIVVLEDGKIAEKGNHEDLMKKQGFYYYLVSNSKEE